MKSALRQYKTGVLIALIAVLSFVSAGNAQQIISQGIAWAGNGHILLSATAPTIASGFGTSPSIVASNGTTAFTVNVGTGGSATAGVITMPAATTGWVCEVHNLTALLGNVANVQTVQIATSTTSVTVESQTISTGVVVAWTASDVLQLLCAGY